MTLTIRPVAVSKAQRTRAGGQPPPGSCEFGCLFDQVMRNYRPHRQAQQLRLMELNCVRSARFVQRRVGFPLIFVFSPAVFAKIMILEGLARNRLTSQSRFRVRGCQQADSQFDSV